MQDLFSPTVPLAQGMFQLILYWCLNQINGAAGTSRMPRTRARQKDGMLKLLISQSRRAICLLPSVILEILLGKWGISLFLTAFLLISRVENQKLASSKQPECIFSCCRVSHIHTFCPDLHLHPLWIKWEEGSLSTMTFRVFLKVGWEWITFHIILNIKIVGFLLSQRALLTSVWVKTAYSIFVLSLL